MKYYICNVYKERDYFKCFILFMNLSINIKFIFSFKILRHVSIIKKKDLFFYIIFITITY